MLKHRSTTSGPLVFKFKHSLHVKDDPVKSPDERVKAVEPLRLGFDREGNSWEQSDWPAEIRRRVAEKKEQDTLAAAVSTLTPEETKKQEGELSSLLGCC